MAETFGSLAARIRAQDPLTPDELEKLIAHRVGEIVDLVFKDIVLGQDTVALQDAIKEKFGFCCEIAPAISIYVNISANPGQNDIPAFSTLPFEEAIRVIQENFQSLSPEEIREQTQQAVNACWDHFLHAVLLSNPILTQIRKRFQIEFGENLAINVRMPVKILFEDNKRARSHKGGFNSEVTFQRIGSSTECQVTKQIGANRGGFVFLEAAELLNKITAYQRQLESIGIPIPPITEIGRASCRERVCQYV